MKLSLNKRLNTWTASLIACSRTAHLSIRRSLFAFSLLGFAALSLHAQTPYLFVWAGDDDKKDPDFLAVIDTRPGSPNYGKVVATLPTGERSTFPHHTEYEFPKGSMLLANGWGAGQTFIFDLRDPLKPKLAGSFKERGDYAFPHSFARLPNGHLLGTFQVKKAGFEPPGALIEIDADGKFLRGSSSAVAGIDNKQLWPYSLLVLPDKDRVVTTSTEMGLPAWAQSGVLHESHDVHTLADTRHIQIWRLSDLRLLATIPLESPGGRSNLNPAEPRLLPDGSIYVNTFNCGLFRITGVDGLKPKTELVYEFPGVTSKEECAVPVVIGKYWIQTDPSLPGLVVLDVSDPAKPVEASRLVLGDKFPKPHWVAADRGASRIVVTGNNRSWVLLVNIDVKTGKLTIDQNFRMKSSDSPGVDFDRAEWPHGKTGKAWVHGALFGPNEPRP